jgi:hypothetical protein
MKDEEDQREDHTSIYIPVHFKINSSIQHLRTDLMQHWFVTTYLRQITNFDPPRH